MAFLILLLLFFPWSNVQCFLFKLYFLHFFLILIFFPRPPYLIPKRERKEVGEKKRKKENGNKVWPYTQLGRPMTLGNNLQLLFLGKERHLFDTFASGRMIATELLCHGDNKKVQVGVLQRNHGGGRVGWGGVLSHVALLNC